MIRYKTMLNFLKTKKENTRDTGFVLLYAIVLSSMLLAITMGVMNIAVKEVKFGTSGVETNDAFFAADVGVECALLNDKAGKNSFVQTGGTGTVTCLGDTMGLSGGYPFWSFIISGLGNGGDGCARVTVDKSTPPEVFINSKGYNKENGSCGSVVSGNVERELQVSVGGTGVGDPPLPGESVLTVSKGGTGGGTVTSSPAGIDCGASCTFNFTEGDMVTLSASPDASSVFNGWSGACTGTGACNLTLAGNMSVGANFGSTSNSNVTFVAANDAGGDTVLVPVHQAGDLLILFAYRDGASTVKPQTPAGWTEIGTSEGSDTNSSRLAYIIDSDGSIGSVTSTNATETLVHIYRGNSSTTPIGANASSWGYGSIITYPALSLNNTSGSSWVASFAGHRGGSAPVYNPPLGMINRTYASAAGSAAGHDTGEGVSSWGSADVSMDPFISGWKARTVEIMSGSPTPPPGSRVLTVTPAGGGIGTVTSSPSGISCGSICSAGFSDGASVTLTATPDANSSFAGWSGACTGTGSCVLSMTSDQAVMATFNLSAQIAFDASSDGTTGGTAAGSLTIPHTVGAGSNRILVVGVSMWSTNAPQVSGTGMTYAGQPMTLIAKHKDAVSGARIYTELWYMLSPPSGLNNVYIPFSVSTRAAAGVVSYSGVNQTTPLGTAVVDGRAGTNPSISVTSQSGELVVDVVGVKTSASATQTLTKAVGQTERYNKISNTGDNNVLIAGSDKPGSTSTSMSWTANPSITPPERWAMVAVPLKPGAAPPPVSRSLTVSLAGTGSGTVSSSPSGISCSPTCFASFTDGTSVTLTALAGANSSFVGWSGACTGTGSCVLSMTSDKSVTATFNTAPPASRYARAITISYLQVQGSNQTNFPVLVSGTYPYLSNIPPTGKVKNANGYDIGFYSDANLTTKLAWETEKYVAATGEVAYWVKVPMVSATADTVFYMGYGDASITTDQSSKTAVWDANYKGVWHLPDGVTLGALDSTSSLNNGTINGSVTATTGQFDGGANFPGSANISKTSATSLPALNTDQTMEFWLNKPSASGNQESIFTVKVSSSGNATQVVLDSSGRLRIKQSAGTNIIGSTAVPSNSVWHHIAFTRVGSNNKLYIDGVQCTSSCTSTTAPLTGTPNTIYMSTYNGATNGTGEPYTGKLDEVRISNVGRSADWLKTSYNNQSSPSTFYTVGAEVGLP